MESNDLLCSTVTNQIAFDQQDSESSPKFEYPMDRCCLALVSKLGTSHHHFHLTVIYLLDEKSMTDEKYFIWRTFLLHLQSDWPIDGPYKTIRTTFSTSAENRSFSSFHCSGIRNSQNSIKLLSCLIFRHFKTGQTSCKH